MSSPAAQSADRGGGAERRRGSARINAAALAIRREAALRLRPLWQFAGKPLCGCGSKPPRSVGPLPLFASQTEGDIAVSQVFNYAEQRHCHGAICLHRRLYGDTGGRHSPTTVDVFYLANFVVVFKVETQQCLPLYRRASAI